MEGLISEGDLNIKPKVDGLTHKEDEFNHTLN